MPAIKRVPEAGRSKGRPRAFDRGLALRKALEIFWRRGYEPASVAELCQAMGINPPSLYACFGNKASLFLEAVDYYERAYWDAPAKAFLAEPDIVRAVSVFFDTAASLLLSPDTPCGCMVVLAAVNVSGDAEEIVPVIRRLRQETREMFAERLRKALADRQIPPDTDVRALAGALNTLLEGLSIQARDGMDLEELKVIAGHAVRLLPAARGASAG